MIKFGSNASIKRTRKAKNGEKVLKVADAKFCRFSWVNEEMS